MVPLRNPRTLLAFQPVSSTNSSSVAPFSRRRSSTIWVVLMLFGSAALLALLVSLVAGLAAFSFAMAASPRSRPALVIFGAFVFFAFISVSSMFTVIGIIRYDFLGLGADGSSMRVRTVEG